MFGKSKKIKAIVNAIAIHISSNMPNLIQSERIQVAKLPQLDVNKAYEVYACQWGCITFLALYISDEVIRVVDHMW